MSTLQEFLTSCRRRQRWIIFAEGAAAGAGMALVLALLGWPSPGALFAAVGIGIGLAVIGGVSWTVIVRHRGENIAQQVELRAPECRNLVITAEELLQQDTRADPAAGARAGEYLGSLVFRDAARVAQSLNPARLFPARRLLLALGLSVMSLTLITARAASFTLVPELGPSSTAATIDDIHVTITPPVYTGEKNESVGNPTRLQALAGSRLQFTIRAHAATIAVETLAGRQLLTSTGTNDFSGNLVADADGYIALVPTLADGQAGPRRLIGLSVTSDTPPRVRITKPGRDLRMLDGNQTLDLAVESDDDIGLATVRLLYTRVAGSGERYTFTEGEVPLTITRTDPRTWTATAHWRLNPLALEPGDLVVYRAVATDRRPEAAPTESDAYIAEVIAPGGEAAGGFGIDTDLERYALSEQMVILKSERLLARRASMAADSFANGSADLAAEQRSVRAEFVFMMGGEIAAAPTSMTMLNEEGEAAGESDLAAGYSRNQGRDALLGAIRSMSRASGALTEVDVSTALVHERAALAQLERAFSHTRIILRALTEHEQLDLTRRLTGTLVDAGRETHPSVTPEPIPLVSGLRQALAGIATLAAERRLNAAASAQAAALAESVLRIDPSSQPLQQVATLLTNAATAMTQSRNDEAHPLLDRAATLLTAILRARLLDAPRLGPAVEAARLEGALTDALRRMGGGQ